MKNNQLGVVCCYFNPCGYKSKYDNFITFYSALKKQIKDIHVVELSSPLPLPEEVEGRLISSDSILWHKENLLNLGIGDLINDGYKNIAWLDADILFQDGFWVKDTVDCLNNYKLCQLFSRAHKSQPNGTETSHPGCVRYWSETGNLYPINTLYHTGYAWAARSECLEGLQLYDKSILGGGDSLVWFGAFDGIINVYELLQFHPIFRLEINAYIIDYLDWSEKWGKIINGEVSYVYNNVQSLPHGNNSDKHYISRYNILAKHNYSPKKDLIYNNGILECTNKGLSKDIFKYFKSRKEDNSSLLRKFSNFLNKLAIKKEIEDADRRLSKSL
jgi:hypothetical protein